MKRRITSRIAMCHDCSWRYEDIGDICLKVSKGHAKRYKHCVSVEMASVIVYDEREQPK